MVPRDDPSTRPTAPLIAPRWHTVALVALFLSVTALGFLSERQGGPHPPPAGRIGSYSQMVVVEWGLFLFVWLEGLRRHHTRVRDVVGGSWSSARAVIVDVAL